MTNKSKRKKRLVFMAIITDADGDLQLEVSKKIQKLQKRARQAILRGGHAKIIAVYTSRKK